MSHLRGAVVQPSLPFQRNPWRYRQQQPAQDLSVIHRYLEQMFSLSPRYQHPGYTWQRHTHPDSSKLLLTVMCHLNKAGTKNPSWHRKLCPVLSQMWWWLVWAEGDLGRPKTDLITRLPRTSLARWPESNPLYLVFVWEDGWEEVAFRLARGVRFGLHRGVSCGLHFFR